MPELSLLKRLTERLGCPLILLLLTIGVFWKLTLTRQYTWMAGPDLANQVLPWYEMQARAWHAGEFPLWDPYQWAGQPLLGQVAPGAAYPLNWLLFLMPLRDGRIRPEFLDGYFVLIHFLGALFAYLLCRELGRSRAASTIAGSAFGLCGYIGYTDWPQMLNGAIWCPVILLGMARVWNGKRPWASAALGGVAAGMAWLSGHHQIPIFQALVFGPLWIWMIRTAGRRMIRFAAVFALFAFSAGALQIVPAVEYGRRAVRWAGAPEPLRWDQPVPYYVHQEHSLPPSALAGLVLPGFRNSYEVYLGFSVIALSGLALLSAWEETGVRVGAAIAAGGLVMALGAYSFVEGLLYALVPMFEKARSPHMSIIMFHFGLVILFAYGIDYLSGSNAGSAAVRRTAGALAVAAAVLMVTALVLTSTGKPIRDERMVTAGVLALLLSMVIGLRYAGFVKAGGIAWVLGTIVLAEAGLVTGYGFQPLSSPQLSLRQYAAAAPVVEFLRKQAAPVRVEVDDAAVPYNFGDLYGVDAMDGYLASLTENVQRTHFGAEARDRYAVNYRLAGKPSRSDQIEVFRTGNLALYSNQHALPRTWVYHLTPCVAPDNAVISQRSVNSIEVRARLGCPGIVVVAETYFKGWQAELDGRRVPVREMFGALRGVDAGAGEHRIRMRYRPGSFYWGVGLTGAAWLGCAVLWVAPRFRRR